VTGNELKKRREAIGINQEGMARELGVALSTYARWEQLKDNEVPNSKMLDLALKTLESTKDK